jgi:phage-related protein
VTIVYPPLNLELEAKVVKTVYNVLLDRYDSIEISTMKKTLADTIWAMQKEIKSK